MLIDGITTPAGDEIDSTELATLDSASGGNLQGQIDLKLETSLKGTASGLAELDSGGTIPIAQLPAVTITETFVVANEGAMLALTAQTGDVAVRSDLNKSFILQGADAATLGDWQELLTPTDVVLSVAGNTGVVTSGQLVTALEGNFLRSDVADTMTNSLTVSGTTPKLYLNETDGTADNKNWGMISGSGGTLLLRAYDDAYSTYGTAMQMDRTGTTVNTISLTAGSTNINADLYVLGGKIDLRSTSPEIDMVETDGATNAGAWRTVINGGVLEHKLVNDANSATTDYMTVNRTGITANSINLNATAVNVNGNEVYHAGNPPPAGGITDTGHSYALNGYQKLSNGLIMQWGRTGYVNLNINTQVTFPITFPTAVHNLQVSYGKSVIDTGSATAAALYDTDTLTNSGVQIGCDEYLNVGSGYLMWFAIGH